MLRKLALLLPLLLACAEDPNKYTLTPEERARLHPEVPSSRPAESPLSATPVAANDAPAPTPQTEPAPDPQRCEKSRAERVAAAKQAISRFDARVKELAPMIKFYFEHKCELKDTTGSVLVTRTKEAGGTRIAVKHGHQDEIVCNTAKLPPELTTDVMREIVLLDNTAEDDILFSTSPECDDKERPSLRVRYNDVAAKKAILALP